jgi:hypothetical protein
MAGRRKCSFLKERTKELSSNCARAVATALAQLRESLFASFSSEKEDLSSET